MATEFNKKVLSIFRNFTSVIKKASEACKNSGQLIEELLVEANKEINHVKGAVNRLTIDLKTEFSNMGLSPRNLWNKKRFYERFVQAELILQRCVAVLLWGHNMFLLETEFPDMGLAPRNLWNMKRFYERFHTSDSILLRSVAVLPFGGEIPENLPVEDRIRKIEPKVAKQKLNNPK